MVETLNKTAVVLFVDVATAFAAMIRCLLVEDGASKTNLVDKLIDVGFDKDLVDTVVQEVVDLGVWNQQASAIIFRP